MIQFPIVFLNDTQYCSFKTITRNRHHTHGFWEICLVIEGTGRFEHGQNHLPLQPGDLFISEPDVIHEISSLQTRDLELYFIAFDIDTVPAATPDFERTLVQRFLEQHRLHQSGCQHYQPQFEALEALRDQASSERNQWFRTRLLENLILQLLQELLPPSPHPPQAIPDKGILENALAVMEANLGKALTVTEVAQQCHISPRHLRRIFQERLGSTVAAEIRMRKMRRAATLLMAPELSIAEVGYRVGIEDPAQFSRTFKKVYGESPKQFRSSGGTPSLTIQSQRRLRTRFFD